LTRSDGWSEATAKATYRIFAQLTTFCSPLRSSQSLSLTFLAEWGDRSQIATVALASHKEFFGVILGGCIGHAMCTGLACVGGKMLATKISEKSATIFGGSIFLVFGVHSLFFEEV